MKLPKKINILGFNYTVTYEETEQMMRNSWAGMVSNLTKQIHVAPNMPDESKLDTILHEIIHAIDHITSGENTTTLTERQTQLLSTGLESVLRNNKVQEWL